MEVVDVAQGFDLAPLGDGKVGREPLVLVRNGKAPGLLLQVGAEGVVSLFRDDLGRVRVECADETLAYTEAVEGGVDKIEDLLVRAGVPVLLIVRNRL